VNRGVKRGARMCARARPTAAEAQWRASGRWGRSRRAGLATHSVRRGACADASERVRVERGEGRVEGPGGHGGIGGPSAAMASRRPVRCAPRARRSTCNRDAAFLRGQRAAREQVRRWREHIRAASHPVSDRAPRSRRPCVIPRSASGSRCTSPGGKIDHAQNAMHSVRQRRQRHGFPSRSDHPRRPRRTAPQAHAVGVRFIGLPTTARSSRTLARSACA